MANGWNRATWQRGDEVETGAWRWFWHKQRFVIMLDSCDPVTGRLRQIEVSGDEPQWGKWKLVTESAQETPPAPTHSP